MARNGIHYDDVRRAIDTLQQRGEVLNVQRVCELLGTDSYTTVSAHLREWRRQGNSSAQKPPTLERPDMLEHWVADIWQAAQQAAHDTLTAYRQQADERIHESDSASYQEQRQRENAEHRLETLGERLASVQRLLETKTAEANHLQSELQALKGNQSQQQKRISQLEQACQRHQQSLEQSEQQHREAAARTHQAHQAKLAQEEKRHESAETRLMELLDDARRERLKQEKQYEQRLAALDQRCERLQLDLAEHRRQYAQLQETQRSEKALIEQAVGERRLSEDRLRNVQQEKQRLETELKNLRSANREMQDRLSRASLPPTAV